MLGADVTKRPQDLALKLAGVQIPEETTVKPPVRRMSSPRSCILQEGTDVHISFDANGDTLAGTTYVRTRHNNLRCFPRCSDPHNPNSFCGQSLTGAIQWPILHTIEGEIRILGLFRNLKDKPPMEIGDTPVGDYSDQGPYIIGSYLVVDSKLMRFSFIPNRKWQYTTEDRMVASDLHVFTVYLLQNNKCIATSNSNSFHVTPVWTADRDKESQRRTKARMKRKEMARKVEEEEQTSRKLARVSSYCSLEQGPPSLGSSPELAGARFPYPMPHYQSPQQQFHPSQLSSSLPRLFSTGGMLPARPPSVVLGPSISPRPLFPSFRTLSSLPRPDSQMSLLNPSSIFPAPPHPAGCWSRSNSLLSLYPAPSQHDADRAFGMFCRGAKN